MFRIARLSVVALVAACASAAPGQPDRGSVERVHERILTLDTHIDVPLNYATAEIDPGRITPLQADLPKMRAGGLDAAFFIIYTPQRALDEAGLAEAVSIAETRWRGIARMIAAYPDQVALARSAADVARIHRQGRTVALLGMENPFPLGYDLDTVAMWAERGVRYVSITHFGHNQFGDSSNFDTDAGEDAAVHGGLSDLGRELVAELNRLGVMVDVSHAGRDTMLQTVALSEAPVIASHSGARAVADSVRNLDDEQLIALAENGGVAQVVALGAYVRAPSAERLAALEAIRAELGVQTLQARRTMSDETRAAYLERVRELDQRFGAADVEQLVDHIDHIVNLVGIEHVGIASDFDGGGGIDGWRDASETQNVTAALLARGYSERDIAMIWSGNLLRVMREAETTAARIARR